LLYNLAAAAADDAGLPWAKYIVALGALMGILTGEGTLLAGTSHCLPDSSNDPEPVPSGSASCQ
jgi:hypothetical protein